MAGEAAPTQRIAKTQADARDWAGAHVRFSETVQGKNGITWTARIARGSIVFARSAKGQVRYGGKLRQRAATDAVEDYVEWFVRTQK